MEFDLLVALVRRRGAVASASICFTKSGDTLPY
jgi:hypothetical protein